MKKYQRECLKVTYDRTEDLGQGINYERHAHVYKCRHAALKWGSTRVITNDKN